MPAVEIRLLGPIEVDVSGEPVAIRRRKQRAVLALLALRAGEVVSMDRLVDELWGEAPPKAARGSLQNLVSELRKALGAEVLITRAPGYLLDVGREAVDAHRFERLTREARDAAPQHRALQLREALALWRGPALADVQLEHSSADEAGRLEELRVAAWEDRLGAELELGRHSQAIGELESFVSKHPLRERPIGLLMLALYRAGRQSEALETYRRARETLVEELGIDPSPELQRLEQAILRHDSELDLPEAPRKRVPISEPDRRKTVTILFADLVDSTGLGARLDPELLRRVLDGYFKLVRTAVERHGGVVEKFIGDAAMAVFGIPALHEDDGLRAVRAASELRESLAELSAELAGEHGIVLQVRVGLNTGQVFVGAAESGESFATGAAVNVAMRLEQAALPGEILLGESTYGLVRHAVEGEPVDSVDLGGALGRASAFRLTAVGEAVRPLGSAALVGRTDELAWLRAAFAGVQAERRSRVVTVLGDAGVGKSRLAKEFVATAGARALVGRCVSYGQGATFLPLAEIVHQAIPDRPRAAIAALLAGDEQAALIAERITQLSGQAEGAASTGEVFWAVRRFLEGLAAEQPLVIVLEDVHWAEPTLLDLVEYLDAWTTEAPLLVLCLARGELLEERPGWGAENRRLALDGLTEEDAGSLVAEIGQSLDELARARIVEIAEGNPLFLEQLFAFADEAGAEALAAVPPTVDALLAGRLDRVEPEERALLERAAVAGREFSRSALLHLSPPGELPAADGRLTSLMRRGLLRDVRTEGEDAYRFHHVLVRDVAYAGITKEARADLHERFAAWLEQRDGPDEIVGYHLEQAHAYRAELRPGDPELPALAKRAGDLLAEAGIRAFKQADSPATVNLLGRAKSLLPATDPRRPEVLCELAVAESVVGDRASAEAALDEAVEAASRSGDRPAELRAQIELAQLRLHRGGDPDQVVALVREALPELEASGNDRAAGRAWRTLGYVRGSMQGQCAEWLETAERTLPYVRRSGFSTSGCLSEIAAALFYGPTPVPVARARCEDILAAAPDRFGTANVLVFSGGLHALSEQFDEAFEMVGTAEQIYEDLGDLSSLADSSGRIRGRIHVLTGDPQAAEAVFRRCCETFERFQNEAALSTVGSELGQVLYSQGRLTEAKHWSRLSQEVAPPGDIVAQFSWRSLEAKLLAQEGRFDEAEALALEAVSIVGATDAPTERGEVVLDLAEVLMIASRSADAALRVEEALAAFALKQNTAFARRARARFAEAEVA